MIIKLSTITISTIGFVGAGLINTAPVNAAVTYPASSCEAGSTNSIIAKDNTLLMPSESHSDINIALKAGKYDVAYHSFDAHSEHGGQEQLEEQWTFTLTNNAGKVYTSPATADIAEDEDTVIGSFGEIEISEDVSGMTISHNIASWDNAKTAESVYPVCVSFTPVEVEANCEYDTTIKASDENCEEPKVLGDNFTPPVTQLPNTGANPIISALGLGSIAGAIRSLVDRFKK